MAKRTSIYLPDQVGDFIRSYGENSLSGSIATLLERYRAITTGACPELRMAEWCAIVDANNGCGVWLSAGGPDPFSSLWANVADSEPDGLDEKWKVSCLELAERLRQMPLASKAAVWDVAARFWAHPQLQELSFRELLLAVGAKIAEE